VWNVADVVLLVLERSSRKGPGTVPAVNNTFFGVLFCAELNLCVFSLLAFCISIRTRVSLLVFKSFLALLECLLRPMYQLVFPPNDAFPLSRLDHLNVRHPYGPTTNR
jgi:hypothetical protein